MAKDQLKFRLMKNGYDRFAVDASFQEITSEVETLKNKVSFYEKELQDLESQLTSLKNQYQDVTTELSIKEKAAEDITRLALKEANVIIETANGNADSIVREALSTARLILSDLSNISTESSGMREEMRAQIASLIQVVDDIELPKLVENVWMQEFEI